MMSLSQLGKTQDPLPVVTEPPLWLDRFQLAAPVRVVWVLEQQQWLQGHLHPRIPGIIYRSGDLRQGWASVVLYR
jgi:hypothetical protein